MTFFVSTYSFLLEIFKTNEPERVTHYSPVATVWQYHHQQKQLPDTPKGFELTASSR